MESEVKRSGVTETDLLFGLDRCGYIVPFASGSSKTLAFKSSFIYDVKSNRIRTIPSGYSAAFLSAQNGDTCALNFFKNVFIMS